MFTWLKRILGVASTDTVQEPLVLENPIVEEPKKSEPKKTTKKKTATKKSKAVDLDSMNKTQLLAEAKKRGVKANASLKKDEILERIKNG